STASGTASATATSSSCTTATRRRRSPISATPSTRPRGSFPICARRDSRLERFAIRRGRPMCRPGRTLGSAPTRGDAMRRRHTTAALVGVAALVTTIAARQAPQRPSAFAPEGITPVSLGLAGYAKVLCSAVFVSERDPAEAFRNSGYFLFPDSLREGLTYAVDRDRKLVRM